MEARQIKWRTLEIKYKAKLLTLHRSFNTAHSVSATRNNFFVRAESAQGAGVAGFGECGLPPKKPGCYMSDIVDCMDFMAVVADRIQALQFVDKSACIPEIPSQINQRIGQFKDPVSLEILQLMAWLQQFTEAQHYRAPKCALEFALLDLLTKTHHTTPCQLFFGPQASQHSVRSFYTASLEQNTQMLENLRQHLPITRCVKVKYNNDIKGLLELLDMMRKEQVGDVIAVDANCSWTPADFRLFIEGLGNMENASQFVAKIVYIEQPFSFALDQFEQWKAIKAQSPIPILADESFRNQLDLPKIELIAHAVNIKTEKVGGTLATLRAALAARGRNLEIVFGSMCSTQLGCTQTYQFHPLAKFMDIDGALLVKQPALQGGFGWGEGGRVEQPDQGCGLGVQAEVIFQE